MDAQTAPELYRKRYFPDELIHLKDDTILCYDKTHIVTAWNTLKPREDISRGISSYFFEDSIKVSKVFDDKDHLIYWYCDIIRTEQKDNAFIFHDLLVDVIILPDGQIRVVDLDELGMLLKEGKIDADFVSEALTITNWLLSMIYSGNFSYYQTLVNEFDQALAL